MHLLSRKIAKKDLGTVYIFDYDRGRKKKAIFWCFHEENREKREKRKRKRKEEEREKIRKKEERGNEKRKKRRKKTRTLIGKASVMSSLTLPSCLIVFRLRTLSDNELYIKGPFPPSRITSLFSRNASPSFSTSGFRGERALKGESRPGASHAGKIQKQP